MNPRSLRFQVLVWYTAVLTIGFAAVGLFLFLGVQQLLVQSLKDVLSKRVRQIAHICVDADQPLTREYLHRQVTALYAPETPESNGRFVRVSRENGRQLFQSGLPSDGSFDPQDIPFLGYKDEGFRAYKVGAHTVIVRSARVETSQGPVIVELGAATASIEASVRQIALSLLVAGPCLIAVAAIGAYFLVGRALRPVVKLTASAEAITLQKLKERLPVVDTGDELQTLSLALNRMINRLEDAVEATQRFVADASHELRTPLAALRGELETVLHLKNVSGPARDTLASNLEEVERLSKIIERLLALSRMDAGETQSEAVIFDLAQLAASTAEQMSVLAEDKGVLFSCEADNEALARGDPPRIKQVLVNLMDNAINYTPKGKSVTVRVYVEEGHAVLQVLDAGIGIPQEALPYIFDRFYRVDRARSRDVGGAGLGLSIVKAICSAHGAEIKVESVVGIGTNMRVIFPVESGNEVAVAYRTAHAVPAQI